MPLTRDFKETVMELAKDREFRIELLRGTVETYVLEADVVTGNLLLRDYLNATHAFDEVAQQLGMEVSSLRRMLSENGNGRSRNLFGVLQVCLKREGLNGLQVFSDAA